MDKIIEQYQKDKELFKKHYKHLYFDTPEENELFETHYKNLMEKGELPSNAFQKSRDNAEFTRIENNS